MIYEFLPEARLVGQCVPPDQSSPEGEAPSEPRLAERLALQMKTYEIFALFGDGFQTAPLGPPQQVEK